MFLYTFNKNEDPNIFNNNNNNNNTAGFSLASKIFN